jgi:hypothetical protein
MNKEKNKKTVAKHPYSVGKIYFIRTVTMNYTGKLEEVYDGELVLSSAAWIAETGARVADFVKGVLNEKTEIEPFVGKVIVSRGAIVDCSEYPRALTEQSK